MARGMRVCALVLSLVVAIISLNNHHHLEGGGKWAVEAAQVHHVVGGDHGWDPSTDIKSWSSNRDFRVGDTIWFTYSTAQDSISELKNREEYESCDVSNPIRMFTDGIDKVSLDVEGTRYFVSTMSDHCKNGLKLHVQVLPTTAVTATTTTSKPELLAAGPTPSASPPPGLQILSSTTMMISFGLVGMLLSSHL